MGDTQRIQARAADTFDLDLPGDPMRSRSPAQNAEALIRDYGQLRDDIRHHRVSPQDAQAKVHEYQGRLGSLAGRVGPELNARLNGARVEFAQFWSARPEAHVPIAGQALGAQAGARPSRPSPVARQHQMLGRMRTAVTALRRAPDYPQAVLQSLTQGMRPSELTRFAAHTTPAQLRAMARQAGATDAQAEAIADNLQTNAASAFHATVAERALHQLRGAQRDLHALAEPNRLSELSHGMLHGDLQAGRALARQMLGGASREHVLQLLDTYDTTPDPARRDALEGQLRAALREGIADAIENVGHLSDEIRGGALSSATDTELYALAPGAVGAATRELHLASSQGRSMTQGEATGMSLLEAGVSTHAREVQDDAHLRQVTTQFAGWALGLGATAITGGVGAAFVAGMLRSAMRAGLRYGTDSAAVGRAEAARAAGMGDAGAVETHQNARTVHLYGAAAEAAVHLAFSGAQLGSRANADVYDDVVETPAFELPPPIDDRGLHALAQHAAGALESRLPGAAEYLAERALERTLDHPEPADGGLSAH